MQPRVFLLAIAAAAGMLSPAWAHHSHGNYQLTEYTYLEGTVTEFIFINPHSWVYLSVAGDDGESTIWALESGSVRALQRAGVADNTIALGDKVSVRCHQLKDGANGCLLGFLTTPAGVETEWD